MKLFETGDAITLSCINKDKVDSVDDEPYLYELATKDTKQQNGYDQFTDSTEDIKYKPQKKRKTAKVVVF